MESGTIRDVLSKGGGTLDFEEARAVVVRLVRENCGSLRSEVADLTEAHGRVLAEDVLADRDYPALRRSLRDGFAVRAADVPGTMRVLGEVRAGEEQHVVVGAGEALEIMTGAPVPEGADSVIMVEHVIRGASESGQPTVTTDRAAQIGQFVNEQAAEAVQNDVLIAAGTRLDASHVATLAMTGTMKVSVNIRPSVAILATGDEIVGVEEQPQSHQIRNSNSYLLAALVRDAGGIPIILPVARDTREALRASLAEGLTHDMLVVTGGVSAGKYDLVKPALREMGVEFAFERVRIQPGQPTAFGMREGKPVFGLPGNPGSTLVTFQLFARAALELIAGRSETVLPMLAARFSEPFKHKGGLTRFLPARLAEDGKSLRHISWQGSSDVPALARANVFLIADHDRLEWAAGDEIRVMAKP